MRKASRNLETYLVKRVSDVMYQACLDAVKLHENCTDDVAKTIELTEEQYLECKLDWCTTEAWSLLAKHWTSKEYKVKRVAAQASRLKSDDVAQNRGSSRPWGETQQFLVCRVLFLLLQLILFCSVSRIKLVTSCSRESTPTYC